MSEQELVFEQEMVEIFLEEAGEILEQLEEDLLELEKDPGNREVIDSVFRSAHTIKGSAALTGLNSISGFAHALEDVLDKIRKEEGKVPDSYLMVLLDSLDLLKKMIDALTNQGNLEEWLKRADEVKLLLAFITDSTETKDQPLPESKELLYKINLQLKKDLFLTGTDPLMLIDELQEKGEIKKVRLDAAKLPELFDFDPYSLYVYWEITLESSESTESIKDIFIFVDDDVHIEEITETTKAAPAAQDLLGQPILGQPITEDDDEIRNNQTPLDNDLNNGNLKNKSSENHEVRTIRVDTQKLEQIMNDIAELAIAQSRLKELMTNNSNFCDGKDEAMYVFEEVNKITRQIQEEVMRASMVPVGGTFIRFQRMVRDISRERGKEIELIINGQETELDRKVIEQISDPLKHMIRNAVDHGVETPAEREQAGKPRRGQITLNAYYKEGGIIIEVIDDGRGLNTNAILQKAREKGLVKADQELTREEIFNLPFLSGFSTAKEITDISGRGVGLDVVRTNIHALRGTVELESALGVGTKFSIRLPLTLAIIDGMMIVVGEERFLVPVTSIIEFVKLSSLDVKNISGKSPVIFIRGEYVPLISLARELGIKGNAKTADEGMVVVVHDQRRIIALLVDEIVGQEQVVIKSIKENYEQVDGVAGATIMGDGTVAMIVDVSALIRMSLSRPA